MQRPPQKVTFLLIVLCSVAAFAQVRQPAVAGQFYPAAAGELETTVQRLLEQAGPQQIPGDLVGLVAPHAGYVYSGAVAATAYAAIQPGQFDRVVVLAPTHREAFNGATIYPGTAYKTPLGEMKIDQTLAARLVNECNLLKFSNTGHGPEHAVEVQLPFVQTVLPEAELIPIVIGSCNWQMLESLANALATHLPRERSLLIASTDLYHGESYRDCVKTNTATIKAIQAMQPQDFFNGLASRRFSACGGYPVSVLQTVARDFGAEKTQLLSRTNSNDVIGQKGGYVVGYAAVALCRPAQSSLNPFRQEFAPLNSESQQYLIKSARHTLEYFLKNQHLPQPECPCDELNEKRGVFVTLEKDGQLRGCIGRHAAETPLYKLVPEMAVAAAFEDPRFPPLSADELEAIRIKISVYLTNVYPIQSLDEFELGTHGIIMQKGRHAATYLPEVPLQAGWRTKEEELVSLCRKAGLPTDAWKSGAQFWVYQTQRFAEAH